MTFEDVLPGFWDAKSDYLVQPPLTPREVYNPPEDLDVPPPRRVARMRAVEPELDRVLPVWIRKRRGGWAGDEQRLRELRGR
jgi:hypothetical protein